MNSWNRWTLITCAALAVGCGADGAAPDPPGEGQTRDDRAPDNGPSTPTDVVDGPAPSNDPVDPSDPVNPDDPMKPEGPEYLGEWYRAVGSAGPDWARSVAVDAAGNVYAAGTFDTELTFGPHTVRAVPGEFEPRPDVFVVSFDAQGEIRWLRSYGSEEADLPASVLVDADGNVFIVGSHQAPFEIDGTRVPHLGAEDLHVVSYDTDGVFRWVETFGGPYGESPRDAAISESGQLAITGSFQGIFSAGDYTLSSMNEWAAMEVFTMRLDTASRRVDWVRGFAGFLIDVGTTVGIGDDGTTVVGVSLQYDLTIDAATTFEVGDAFASALVAISDGGMVVWSQLFEGDGASEVIDLAVTTDGSVVATGVLSERLRIGDIELTNPRRGHDTWVARFDSAGMAVWARSFGDEGFDQPLGLVRGPFGLYVSGRFDEDIQFGDDHELRAVDGYDIYIASFDPMNGDVRWARSFGGEGDDQPGGVGVDPGRGVYLGGYVSGALMFNDDLQPAAGGSIDAFVLRLEEP